MGKVLAPPKKSGKLEKEKRIILGLVDFYIKSGKPVGSVTLKEAGFEDLSSATLRNYFASLEETGYLTQAHASGGRIPTPKAFKYYAREYLDQGIINSIDSDTIHHLALIETKEIVKALHKMAEELSRLSKCAAFISSPRFDHDTILDVKTVAIDANRILVILITDFGQILTETLTSEKPINQFGAKRIEAYFKSRLLNLSKPDNIEPGEEEIALKFYNETMVRYLVGYSQFNMDELYKTGFSRLLNFPEFHDPLALSQGLTLFENEHSLRMIVREGLKHQTLKVWVGDDLNPYIDKASDMALMSIPYYINQRPVGLMGLLGPARVPYREFFGLLRAFSESTSHLITHNLYKFKISLRHSFLLDGPEFKLLTLNKS